MSVSHGGLLSGLTDPKFMAELAERTRIAEKIAGQMGVTLEEARAALRAFAADTSSEGHTLH
ncbi:hypothetical protein AB4853_11495 [Bradyrhizobium sp. 1050_B9_N1_2]|jgi:hypothetical protein|uniref:hypothetical protein n=1 Tax=Bradyrhizobium sp. 1050_B9_N1_2 TaxID=3238688 RepID=UPI003EDB9716